MIIKRWDTTSSQWEEEYPKTTIANVFLADGTTAAFSGGKISESLLPNSVFDNLKFKGTVAGNAAAAAFALALEGIVTQATTDERDEIGYYLVFSSGGTINQATSSVQTTLGNNKYYQWTFTNNDAGATGVTSSGTVETGDWVVVNGISGDGSLNDPFIFTLAIISNTYELATSTVPGIIQLGDDTEQTVAPNGVSDTTGRTYAIQKISTGKAVVNVPWTDTTYSTATSSVLGLVKIGYSENGKNYPVELDNGQMFVNVPWENTTYTGSNGVTLVGNDFRHADTSSVSDVDNSHGTVIQDLTFDTFGHVTATGSVDLDNRYYTETEIDVKLGKRNELYVQASAPSTTTSNAIWFDI